MSPNSFDYSVTEIKIRQDVRASWMVFILFITTSTAWTQEVDIRSGFIEDSLRLGEPVTYYLAVDYPENMEVYLPDSLHTYSPFLLRDRSLTETSVVDSIASDSVLYRLISFEIDAWQKLALPVYVYVSGDSIELQSPTDSIAYIEITGSVTDTTQLKSNTEYIPLRRQVNLPLILIIGGSVLVLAAIFLIIFWKRIQLYFALKQLRKRQMAFEQRIDQAITGLRKHPNMADAEHHLTYWKQHLQYLTRQPFASATTKDILKKTNSGTLEIPLKNIDRMVYGGRGNDTVHQDFQNLRAFANNIYTLRVEEIKDGKR